MPKSPIFLERATTLVPLPGSTMQKNAFGIDVLNRPFHAPRATAKSLVPASGSGDIYYSGLSATGNYGIREEEGLTCTLNVEYKGLLNNVRPPTLASSGMSVAQVSATRGDAGSADAQRTWDIVYYSPSITYRYVSVGRAAAPIYGGLPTDGTATIITESITDGNGRRKGSAPGITQVLANELANFASNPVPGTPYYETEETWRLVVRLVVS